MWFLRTTKDARYTGILDRYFDTIKGEVRWTRIAGPTGFAPGGKVAPKIARSAYVKARDAALPAGWMELNVALYSA